MARSLNFLRERWPNIRFQNMSNILKNFLKQQAQDSKVPFKRMRIRVKAPNFKYQTTNKFQCVNFEIKTKEFRPFVIGIRAYLEFGFWDLEFDHGGKYGWKVLSVRAATLVAPLLTLFCSTIELGDKKSISAWPLPKTLLMRWARHQGNGESHASLCAGKWMKWSMGRPWWLTPLLKEKS